MSATLEGKCSTCGGPLVWAGGRLVCPRPACPGHSAPAAAEPVCAIFDYEPEDDARG